MNTTRTAEAPDLPIIPAHELGHYFDLMKVSEKVRERRANKFMVSISAKHGLSKQALKLKGYRP